jgi:CRISPR-associated protein Csh1
MLEAMRTLGLDFLHESLSGDDPPENLDDWHKRVRRENPERPFPFLVEDIGAIQNVYVIQKTVDGVVLEVREMKPEILPYVPFVKPSGAQSPQIGPVIKRSYSKAKGGGPSAKILNSTMKSFHEVAEAGQPWSPYFTDIVSILEEPTIRLLDGKTVDWSEKGYDSMLECVVQEIGEAKGTMLVTVADAEGKWPGQRPEYLNYLMKEKLAGDRYLVGKIQPKEEAICPLCGETDVTVYANALKGAGLNFLNMDREGRFPGISVAQAWKSYALCVECADLLYVYKNHVIKKAGPKKDKRPFVTRIAGENALVVPFSTMDSHARMDLLKDVLNYVETISRDVETEEDDLLELLKEERAVLNLNFLWADIGQNIENVRGVLTDVPPSRLRTLSVFNAESENWSHPLFPEVSLAGTRFNLRPNLALGALSALFFRPGGKKAQSTNAGKRLFQLRRIIAASVYHARPIPEDRFWEELITTAGWWWLDALTRGDAYGLLHEGRGKKGPYLTAAGWIRHVCWWLFYFKKLGVLPMEESFYEPEMESLKPFFGPESGIDTPQKAYAFLLGVLYGRLLQIQGARGVNVGANALTWLKRLTLNGKDLPELYVKIRGKLLTYGAEKSALIRELIEEIGRIGLVLPEKQLNAITQTQANYFLLLGQSMTRAILKKEDAKTDSADAQGDA